MKTIENSELDLVCGGLDGPACTTAAMNGFGIGAAVGGGIGMAGGVVGAAIGGMLGGLMGGAAAVSGNAACGTGGASTGDCGTGSSSCSASCGNDGSSSGDGGGGGGGGKVVCTELCRRGVIDHEVWMADLRYSRENFSSRTMRGYHLWGIPCVRLMRRYPLLAEMAERPTRWFAEDIAYRMGVCEHPNLKGWVLREVLFRPLCSLLGTFAKARDWRVLWTDGKSAV